MKSFLKKVIALSTITCPGVGYYVDYRKDTVIYPSTNAACYAERDIEEPTPETPELSSDELSSGQE